MNNREKLTAYLEAAKETKEKAVNELVMRDGGVEIIMQCKAHQYAGGANLEAALNCIFSDMVDELINDERLASNETGKDDDYFIGVILSHKSEVFSIDCRA